MQRWALHSYRNASCLIEQATCRGLLRPAVSPHQTSQKSVTDAVRLLDSSWRARGSPKSQLRHRDGFFALLYTLVVQLEHKGAVKGRPPRNLETVLCSLVAHSLKGEPQYMCCHCQLRKIGHVAYFGLDPSRRSILKATRSSISATVHAERGYSYTNFQQRG